MSRQRSEGESSSVVDSHQQIRFIDPLSSIFLQENSEKHIYTQFVKKKLYEISQCIKQNKLKDAQDKFKYINQHLSDQCLYEVWGIRTLLLKNRTINQQMNRLLQQTIWLQERVGQLQKEKVNKILLQNPTKQQKRNQLINFLSNWSLNQAKELALKINLESIAYLIQQIIEYRWLISRHDAYNEVNIAGERIRWEEKEINFCQRGIALKKFIDETYEKDKNLSQRLTQISGYYYRLRDFQNSYKLTSSRLSQQELRNIFQIEFDKYFQNKLLKQIIQRNNQIQRQRQKRQQLELVIREKQATILTLQKEKITFQNQKQKLKHQLQQSFQKQKRELLQTINSFKNPNKDLSSIIEQKQKTIQIIKSQSLIRQQEKAPSSSTEATISSIRSIIMGQQELNDDLAEKIMFKGMSVIQVHEQLQTVKLQKMKTIQSQKQFQKKIQSLQREKEQIKRTIIQKQIALESQLKAKNQQAIQHYKKQLYIARQQYDALVKQALILKQENMQIKKTKNEQSIEISQESPQADPWDKITQNFQRSQDIVDFKIHLSNQFSHFEVKDIINIYVHHEKIPLKTLLKILDNVGPLWFVIKLKDKGSFSILVERGLNSLNRHNVNQSGISEENNWLDVLHQRSSQNSQERSQISSLSKDMPPRQDFPIMQKSFILSHESTCCRKFVPRKRMKLLKFNEEKNMIQIGNKDILIYQDKDQKPCLASKIGHVKKKENDCYKGNISKIENANKIENVRKENNQTTAFIFENSFGITHEDVSLLDGTEKFAKIEKLEIYLIKMNNYKNPND